MILETKPDTPTSRQPAASCHRDAELKDVREPNVTAAQIPNAEVASLECSIN